MTKNVFIYKIREIFIPQKNMPFIFYFIKGIRLFEEDVRLKKEEYITTNMVLLFNKVMPEARWEPMFT